MSSNRCVGQGLRGHAMLDIADRCLQDKVYADNPWHDRCMLSTTDVS